MKIIGWAMAAALTVGAAPAFAGEVAVTLNGVQDKGGQMLISLQTRDQYMKPAGAAGTYGPAAPGKATFVIRDVAPGEYAVMVMHDANGDWQMQMGADRRPAEGWARSGPGGAGATPPTFDQVKITVPETGTEVSLDMVYP